MLGHGTALRSFVRVPRLLAFLLEEGLQLFAWGATLGVRRFWCDCT